MIGYWARRRGHEQSVGTDDFFSSQTISHGLEPHVESPLVEHFTHKRNRRARPAATL